MISVAAPNFISPLLLSASNTNVVPDFISSVSIVNPPILPPVNNTCEPVTLPPAETLNLLDENYTIVF